MLIKRIASVEVNGENVVGAIWGEEDCLVFERDEDFWLAICRVKPDGPAVAVPGCFRPRTELLDALERAYQVGQPVPFQYEVLAIS